MSALMPVADALAAILKTATVTKSEDLPLIDCVGRVLAQDTKALRTQPPFHASAMDGYAVRAADILETPYTLNQIGESAAGHPFKDRVGPNECVRIFTGAPLPNGSDTIVIQENTKASGTNISILQSAETGNYVRPAGIDFSQDETLLKAGTIIDAGAISLAASMNHTTLTVRCKPTIAIIATGDELQLPGSNLKEGEIIASNSFGVVALVEQAGGKAIDLGIAKDTLEDLKNKFQQTRADVTITLGGASVGDHDLVQDALEAQGVKMNFWKLAMRPGKPVMFGTTQQGSRYLGLPGNPVSSLVCTTVFLVPLIKAMLGLPPQNQRQNARLAIDLPANNEREEYMRAVSETRGDERHVTPVESQDSSRLSLYHQADCLIVRPANAPQSAHGETCTIISL